MQMDDDNQDQQLKEGLSSAALGLQRADATAHATTSVSKGAAAITPRETTEATPVRAQQAPQSKAGPSGLGATLGASTAPAASTLSLHRPQEAEDASVQHQGPPA